MVAVRCLYGCCNDVATSKTGSSRKEFRFGRDTVEILDALNQLKVLGVRVIFEQEELILQTQTVI